MDQNINYSGDNLLEVKKVYKKFCKTLKRSMIYGFADMFTHRHDNAPLMLRKGEFWVLKNVSFTLKRGEILGILGLNGAGKTTLIRLITGSYPVSQGEIKVSGRISTVFEKSLAFNKLYSGIENIKVKCALFGMTKNEIRKKLDYILDFAGIRDFKDAPFGTYSAGMRARVNFAVALAADPDIMIIDEGLAVSDLRFRRKCYNEIIKISKNKGIILVSHNMELIKELTNRVIVIDKGELIYETDKIKDGIEYFMENTEFVS